MRALPNNCDMNWMSDRSSCSVVRVGQYQLNEVIGKGNFAIVRLATHLPTGTKVAIKVIEKSRLDGKSLHQMLQEISILKKLNHPHIIKLYQVMQTTKLIYLVTEYASGGEIFDHIVAHGRMNEREARGKFKQIVSGLLYCRQQHIVHRDLKAENLLLDQELNVKIADFGFSVVCIPGKKLVTCCGSPQYAAPELFEGHEYDGEMVDIWSLGIILYVMTVGHAPYVGSNVEEIHKCIQKGFYKIPFFMSTECEALLKRLLCYDPVKRISLMEIVDHEWMRLDGEDPAFNSLVQRSLSLPVYDVDSLINPHILAAMEKMNYSIDNILTSLRDKIFDHNWATYHILLDRQNKRWGTGIASPPGSPIIVVTSNDDTDAHGKKETSKVKSVSPASPTFNFIPSSRLALPPNLHNNSNDKLPSPEILVKYLAMRRNTYDHVEPLKYSLEHGDGEHKHDDEHTSKKYSLGAESIKKQLNLKIQKYDPRAASHNKLCVKPTNAEVKTSCENRRSKSPRENPFLKIKSPECLEKDYRTTGLKKDEGGKHIKLSHHEKKGTHHFESLHHLITPLLKNLPTIKYQRAKSFEKVKRTSSGHSLPGHPDVVKLMEEKDAVFTSL